ncbi:VOC family protein [Fimbriimonas ginsengisoli]|nr:VOC family protein [Fimbriimonas ginsengisoli]
MPNLENLRKRAKGILRRHREGDFSVASAIRSALPRFAGWTDRDILQADFRLKDAQEVVARQHGFDSWQSLAERIDSMSKNTPSSTNCATLTRAEPQLFVTDIAIAFEYFGKLGFSVVFAYGDPPFYAQVARDGVALNLRYVQDLPFDLERMERDSLLAASIVLKDAKALFLEYQEAGVEFHQRLREEPWGAHTFVVKAPDGNLILFAGAAPRSA